MTELQEKQLMRVKKLAVKNGYVSIDDIKKIFNNLDSDELDRIVEVIENSGIDVTENDIKQTDLAKINDEMASIESQNVDLMIDEIKEEYEKRPRSSSKTGRSSNLRQYLAEIGEIERISKEEEIEYAKCVQAGLKAKVELSHLDDSSEPIDEVYYENLIELSQKGEAARNVLIESNLRLVIPNAKMFSGRGLPFLDLIQEGNMGLMKAVNKYNPNMGYKLSTYATWWIRQQIRRALANHSRTIRIPVHIHDLKAKIGKATWKLSQKLNRDPSNAEIAEEVGISIQKLEEVYRLTQETVSLDKTINDEDNEFIDTVEDENTATPFEVVSEAICREKIEELLKTLSEKEQKIIRNRFGLDGKKPASVEELAREFSLSKSRIRQIEAEAIRKMRHPARIKIIKDDIDKTR